MVEITMTTVHLEADFVEETGVDLEMTEKVQLFVKKRSLTRDALLISSNENLMRF
jgi:hypothetical protein